MELYLNSSWKKIGISLSGGADSALLAYLICSQTDADIHFTHQIRMWKTRPWQTHVFQNVTNWFKINFNNTFYIHKNLVPPELEEPNTTLIEDEYGKLKSGNRIILRSFNEYIAHRENLDALYGGVNQNPDIKFKGALEERYKGHVKPYFVHDNINIIHPFVHTQKDWIIKQYYKYDIEDLLNITRSCEGEFEEINYKTYTPGQYVPTCGECFWCKEREWAIEQATK
jgi:7-cyano-7-deazaguanine synthase in queuosine biosynthesis